MAEEESGALSGIASGAASGAAFGLPGAVIGGVIGGITGFLGGRKKREARRARAKLAKLQNFQARRAFLNNFFEAQSSALAQGALTGADLGSSGVQGELASLRTQATTGLIEQSEGIRLSAVAAKADRQAATIAGVGALAAGTADAVNTVRKL